MNQRRRFLKASSVLVAGVGLGQAALAIDMTESSPDKKYNSRLRRKYNE